MPKPLFIICAESGSEDRSSGLVSVFNIFEKIAFRKMPAGQVGHPFKMRIIAVWSRAANDPEEGVCETEIVMLMPPDATPLKIGAGEFPVEKGKDMFRTFAVVDAPIPLSGSGPLEVQCKLRMKGTKPWVVQSYPIAVEEMPPEGEGEVTGADTTAKST